MRCSFLPVLASMGHLKWTTKRLREIHCLFEQLVGSKTIVFWRCACCCGMYVTLDTFWRARIDLSMHGFVEPQTHLPIFPSVFVYTSSRVVFEALDRRCDGHRGLPHACLSSESVRHVSFLPKQLVDLFVKTMIRDHVETCSCQFGASKQRFDVASTS